MDAQWTKCHGKQEAKRSGEKHKNTSNNTKTSNLKSRGSGYPVFIRANILPKKEKHRRMEKREVQKVPQYPSHHQQLSPQPAWIFNCSHTSLLTQLCPVGIDLLFQLVLHQAHKSTSAGQKEIATALKWDAAWSCLGSEKHILLPDPLSTLWWSQVSLSMQSYFLAFAVI